MQRPERRAISRLLLTILVAVVAAAGATTYVVLAASPRPPTTLSGTIEIDGSSTVFLITEAVAEEFGKQYPDVRVNVGISGTGGGFKRFVVGETDISDASRPIKSSEIEQAQANSIEYVEIRVAKDGLAVTVHPSLTFVSCLTIDELKRIWEPESTVDSWNDVRAEWPDLPLRLYGPGTDSGTFDYFTERVVGKEDASRADYTASEDDNVLVQGIAGDSDALGYFGYAYFAENEGRLRLVAVDDGQGCTLPSDATVKSGDYPLSRPLFIYVNAEALQRPEVRAFVEFYLENALDLVAEVGYTPYERTIYQEQLTQLRASR